MAGGTLPQLDNRRESMTKHEEMQAFVRYYKQQNNKTVVTMAEIAQAAIAQGWPVPSLLNS